MIYIQERARPFSFIHRIALCKTDFAIIITHAGISKSGGQMRLNANSLSVRALCTQQQRLLFSSQNHYPFWLVADWTPFSYQPTGCGLCEIHAHVLANNYIHSINRRAMFCCKTHTHNKHTPVCTLFCNNGALCANF